MNSNDIAKIAGVSRSTVSRVVNNYPNVPDETREKVLKVIREHNYVPHAPARTLAGYKNRIIGLFIIDIVDNKNTIKNRITKSPYYLEFTSSVIEAASEKGYKVLVHIIHNAARYDEIRECFCNKTISGGILIGENSREPVVDKLIDDGYKVALIDQDVRLYETNSKCIIVNSDNFNGAYNATKYLINLNHKNIAHITGDLEKYSAIERIRGYKKALEDFNIPINKELIINSKFLEDEGYKAAKKLLLKNTNVTAIFASNDKIAIGAIRAIKELGLRIPDDISVIGFDDIEECKYLDTPLTTIKMELAEMAEITVNSLISSIEKDINVSAYYEVPVKLTLRQTCKGLE